MCLKEYGVQTFRKYKFQKPEWKHYKKDSIKNFKVQKSLISNAGKGVFAKKEFQSEDFLMYYYGEPMEEWVAEAIDDENCTSVALNLPRLGKCCYRGIYNTLGVFINSAIKDKDANVEFVIDRSQINHKDKIIYGEKLIYCRVKPNVTIKPGDELLLFYGPYFWKNFKHKDDKYCCICVSIDPKPSHICIKCNSAFHKNCLTSEKPNLYKQKKTFMCFNCL